MLKNPGRDGFSSNCHPALGLRGLRPSGSSARLPSRRSVVGGIAGIAAALPLRAVAAYHERAITLIVPVAPGGMTAVPARVGSDHLARALRQPVVVENRPGASGNIGTAAVARSAPDGYTFLFNTMSVHTMNQALCAAMPFDGVHDFSPITLLAYRSEE